MTTSICTRPTGPIAPWIRKVTLRALDELVRSQGASHRLQQTKTSYGLMKGLWTSDKHGLARYETIQNNFSLLYRRFEDELAEVCRREKISLLPYSPIAGGVLSGKYHDGAEPPRARFTLYKDYNERTKTMLARFLNPATRASTARFMEIAQGAGMAPATLATAWTLNHNYVASTIIGATRVQQLDDTLAAANVTLSAEVIDACNAVSKEIQYPMG